MWSLCAPPRQEELTELCCCGCFDARAGHFLCSCVGEPCCCSLFAFLLFYSNTEQMKEWLGQKRATSFLGFKGPAGKSREQIAALLHPMGVLTCISPTKGTGGSTQQIWTDPVLPKQAASHQTCAPGRHIYEVASPMLFGFDRKRTLLPNDWNFTDHQC